MIRRPCDRYWTPSRVFPASRTFIAPKKSKAGPRHKARCSGPRPPVFFLARSGRSSYRSQALLALGFLNSNHTAAIRHDAWHAPLLRFKRVPVLLMGFGIQAGEYFSARDSCRYRANSCNLAGITLAPREGRVLAEALKNSLRQVLLPEGPREPFAQNNPELPLRGLQRL